MTCLVSVVVPFFNEVDNVPLLAEEIHRAFKGEDRYGLECVFVNDGSTDGTEAAIEAAASAYPWVRAVHLERNCGQSAALLAGMRESKGDFVLTLDGDLQNDPADLPGIAELLEDYDSVFGVRVNRQDSWVRKVSSRVANAARNALLHDGVQDTGCGTKGFRRACIEHFVCFNGVHRFFAVFVRSGGFTLTQCPVNHRPRLHGKSKYGIHNRLWRGIYDLVGVAWLRKRRVHYAVRKEVAMSRFEGATDPGGAPMVSGKGP